MLIFTYDKASIDIVIETFVAEFAENMRSNKLTTVPCNYYDDNLEKSLMLLVNKTDNGFVFDENDEIGVEPYGYISDFFECYMHLLQRLKMQFGSLGIQGHITMNDFGVYECVMRKRVCSTHEMECVDFIDQLQCVSCGKWVDVKNAYASICDDDIGDWPMIDDEPLLPNAYGDECAAFCYCSEDCSEKQVI